MGEDIARPTSDNDREGWKAYWATQGMPWRTEPEVGEEKQRLLAERRSVKPDIEKGIYPFRDKNGSIKLTRADVEWLLATHQGPVSMVAKKEDSSQYSLDLRGSDLGGVDLRNLPLRQALWGLVSSYWTRAGREQRSNAAVHLEGANLSEAHLEKTTIRCAHLERTNLGGAHLEGVDLRCSILTEASLAYAKLDGAILLESHLERADLAYARLEEADLGDAHLNGADLGGAFLGGAIMWRAHLEGASLYGAQLAGADLSEAHLEGADLREAHLEGKVLSEDEWQSIGKWVSDASRTREPANLREAFFDNATRLRDISLGNVELGITAVADVQWGGVNLSVISWGNVRILGDEQEAVKKQGSNGKKSRRERLAEFESAVRANRQLATALRTQGLNEHADHFAYRAQLMQRTVLLRQGRWGAALGSWLLDLVSGYGYRPMSSVVTYVATIALFATLYWCVTNDVSLTYGLFTHATLWLGMTPPPPPAYHLQGYEAVVVSMTSFHGRGFFQPTQTPGDKVAILSAIEAAVGLLIEIVFIATFTQRFFAR